MTGGGVGLTLSLDQVLTAIAVIGALAGGRWWGTRDSRRILQRFGDFMSDWHGVEGRPGVPGRPGVMVRLATLEDRSNAIERELHTNGGSTLRDDVVSLHGRVEGLARSFASAVVVLPTQGGTAPSDPMSGSPGASLSVPPPNNVHPENGA